MSGPKNSRMPENINRVEDLGNIHDSVYENMLHEQASRTKTKKRKTREQNANYMREYRASIASTEENEKFTYYSWNHVHSRECYFFIFSCWTYNMKAYESWLLPT